MTIPPISRRGFLGTTIVAGLLATRAVAAREAGSDGFKYEVTRSEAEWKARLSKEEFSILRHGGTEEPKSGELWKETRRGTYACKGCDLHAYDADWKVELDKGWVFFRQSVPNAVMNGIDEPVAEYGMNRDAPALIEVHCRRCGSHLGHMLTPNFMLLHCINGASLKFTPNA